MFLSYEYIFIIAMEGNRPHLDVAPDGNSVDCLCPVFGEVALGWKDALVGSGGRISAVFRTWLHHLLPISLSRQETLAPHGHAF